MQRSWRVYADERVRRDFIAELLAPMLVFGGVALGVGNRSDLWGHVELFFRRGGGTGLVGVGVGGGGGVEIVEIGLEGEGLEGRRDGLGVQNVVDFGFHFELEGVELLEKGAGSERKRGREVPEADERFEERMALQVDAFQLHYHVHEKVFVVG